MSQPLDPVLGSLAFGDVFMRGNPATALATSIGNIDDAPVRKLHRVRGVLRFGEPVVQVSQIGVEIAHGLLLCKHLSEIHADPDVLRRKLIGVEPLSIERDQAIVAIEHAQPLWQVSQRVLEFAHGVAQFALCAVERLLSSPVERGRRQDDEGEQ